jgi:predicted dehydrogenase
MSKPVIALVGCGRWGSLILRDLNLIGCEVRVVIHSKRSTENAYKGGACSTHPSIQSMRADCGKPAGFVVAVPARFHFQTILEILDTFGADTTIFCEKPLTVNSADAKRLCATGAPIFVMDKWRYHPAVRKVTEAVREDQFGPLRSVSLSRVQGGNPHPDVPTAWTYLPHDLAIVLEIMETIPKSSAPIQVGVEGWSWPNLKTPAALRSSWNVRRSIWKRRGISKPSSDLASCP